MTQRLNAVEVDLFLKQPARIVFAEPGRLDQRQALIVRRVGNQIGTGFGKHQRFPFGIGIGFNKRLTGICQPGAATALAAFAAGEILQPLMAKLPEITASRS